MDIDGVPRRPCPQCKRTLPLTDEHWRRNAKRKGGFAGWCKDCHAVVNDKTRQPRDQRYYARTQAERPGAWNERVKAWRAANREKYKALARKNARASEGRRRARKQNGVYSDVTTAHVRALLAKARRCPLCGVPYSKGSRQPDSREIDHIVPIAAGGTHTVGNLRVICRRCNLTRPKDGSDVQGQVELWAAVSDASGTPIRGAEEEG